MPYTGYGRYFDSSDTVTVTGINLPATHSLSFWVYVANNNVDVTRSHIFSYTYPYSSTSPARRYVGVTGSQQGLNYNNSLSVLWEKTAGGGSFDSASSHGTTASGGFITNDYVHITVTRSSTALSLYQNGSLAESDTSITYSSSGDISSNIRFGQTSGVPSSIFENDQNIFDFCAYDRVLSSSEIQGIYNAGVVNTSPITSGLIGRWFLGDDDVLDKSGNGNNGSNSGSTQASVIVPSTPVANPATNIGTLTFDASWSTTTDDDSYQLDVSTASNFSSFVTGYENLAVSSSPVTATGLSDNTTYYYRVRAVEGGVSSANSNVITLTTNAYTTPVTPIANAASSITLTSFSASWSTDLATTSYRLDVSLNSGFTSFLTGYQDLTVTSPPSSITGLTQYTNYYYRVRAVNPAGTSANSNTINALTEVHVNDNSDYSQYLLSSTVNIAQLETIEISHPNFAATHYFVRNHTGGVTVTLENGNNQAFSYLPMQIVEQGSTNDLDYSLSIELGDLGESFPDDLDAIIEADGLFDEPTIIYRTYRHDNLSFPMVGPIELKIKSLSFTKTGVSFEAAADYSNTQKTGELYTLARFPMLRSFL
jgi:hypothetical protein